MSRSAAARIARRESSMYRQGSGWVVSKWDPYYKAFRLHSEMSRSAALTSLRDFRAHRIAQLLAADLLAALAAVAP